MGGLEIDAAPFDDVHTRAEFAVLREPFPAEIVGKLPRSTCRDCTNAPSKVCSDHTKRQCEVCGNYMTNKHIHLDYVGHAAVTDRLLKADPFWSWEPCGVTSEGLPLIKDGLLWIRLTVLGVSRLGVGAADGKQGPDAIKEMIGDALRNAGMRFGIALDLWSKEDLHAMAPEPMAEADVIAALTARMNALPEAAGKRCRAAFRAEFGHPGELRAASERKASALVDEFERAEKSDEAA